AMIAARPLPLAPSRPAFNLSRLLTPLLLLLILYLALVPLLALVYSSVKASGSRLPFAVEGFSLSNFVLVFQSAASAVVLRNTATYVGGSVVVGLTLAVVLTYLLER